MLFKWWNGLFLYQVKPFLFNNRYDLFTWIFMQSGLHQWLLNNKFAWVLFDIGFYSMPLIFWLAILKTPRASTIVAMVMIIVNWTYVQCYTLYPINSIEGHIAWLLFPVLFVFADLKTFYYLLHSLRYFFLFFFSSAGFLKILEFGILYSKQMSGVLLYQHKEFLTSSPDYWYSNFIYWLINHPNFSYLLYLAGMVVELFFVIGFFTKKFDRLLIIAFIFFLLFDVLLMRIHYWEVTPFLITLVFSKYKSPASQPNNYRHKVFT